MKQYKEDLEYFLKDRIFILCMAITAIGCYGYAAATISIGIDTLEGGRYLGSGHNMLQSGRFGQFFWSRVLGFSWKNPYTSYAGDVMAVVLFALTAIHLCILFRRITKDAISKWIYLAFCCVMISFPLTNEIWEFMAANACIRASSLVVSIVLLLLWTQIHGRFRLGLTLPCMAMMTIVCASYESVVAVYVFYVFAILLLQYFYGTEKEKKVKEMFRQGVIYASFLGVGLVMRLVVHRIILIVCHLEAARNGATNLIWGTKSVRKILKALCKDILEQYLFKSVIYFPLTEVLVCLGLMGLAALVLMIRRRSAVLLLPGAGMILSMLLMSLVRGKIAAYRTCQVFTMFVAFSVLLLLHLLQKMKGKRARVLRTGAAAFIVLLCIQQTAYLNYFLTLDHVRSEEEAETVRNIAYDLQAGYDVTKPILFVGTYKLSPTLLEATRIPKNTIRWKIYAHLMAWERGKDYAKVYKNYARKLPSTNIKPVVRWAMEAFSDQSAMVKIFGYYGFKYTAADYKKLYKAGNQYVKDHNIPGYPQEGYIVDMGDYLMVNL